MSSDEYDSFEVETCTIPTPVISFNKKYQNIAPAPTDPGGKSRKYSASRSASEPYHVEQSQSVQRRNARERNRVQQVNNSFARLRSHIPQAIVQALTKGGGRGPHKKVSKVDTLRIAVEYIRRLEDLIEDLSGDSETETIVASSKTTSSGSSSNNNSDASSNSSFGSSAGYSSAADSTPCYSECSSPLPAILEELTIKLPPRDEPQVQPHQPQQLQQLPQPQSQQQQQQRHQHQEAPFMSSSTLLSPISQNSFSPTYQPQLDPGGYDSLNSSPSFDSSTFEKLLQQISPPLTQLPCPTPNDAPTTQLDTQLQFKGEPFIQFALNEEGYVSEGLRDYISMWQNQ